MSDCRACCSLKRAGCEQELFVDDIRGEFGMMWVVRSFVGEFFGIVRIISTYSEFGVS